MNQLELFAESGKTIPEKIRQADEVCGQPVIGLYNGENFIYVYLSDYCLYERETIKQGKKPSNEEFLAIWADSHKD